MEPADTVKPQVVLGAMRVQVQRTICDIFETHQTEMQAMVERAFEEFSWTDTFKEVVEDELNRHARAFVANSMRNVSQNFSSYAAIQTECDELVKLRLTELWLETNKKESA